MLRLALAGLCLAASAVGQPVLELGKSPHAKLRNVPVKAVSLGEGFWTERQRVNVERSIPTLLKLMEEHGVVDNFRRVSGRKQVQRRGPLYTDSDVYKWLEAVAFVLQTKDDPALRATAGQVIEEIVAAQQADGYLNTYYVDARAGERHTNMAHGHELYCLGHMLQAGLAFRRATGDRRLLDSGIRFVEYLLANFGPGKKPIFEGHPEIELALVELYRETGEKKYLDFAGYLLQSDPRLKLPERDLVYLFTGKPFTERIQLEGHAVRAMYAASGATDYFLETGDKAIWGTLERLWDDLAQRKVYITGGVGSRSSGEAFGEPYELPNQLAYTESCAAIGNMIWNWRLLAATGDAKYADMLERALYNGVNSGLSVDGTLYCYRNPLELTGNPKDRIRNPWYDTTCCPPNLERILASLPGYFYSTSPEGLYVHLFHTGELDWKLENGTPLKLRQTTSYPWNGDVDLVVEPAQASEFTLFLRVPEWAQSAKIAVNGQAVSGAPGEYAAIRRTWTAGDRIRLVLPLPVRTTFANPRVRDNIGRAAVERGPLVYCMEGVDQDGTRPLFDLKLVLAKPFVPEYRAGILGGTVVLKHQGAALTAPSESLSLYGGRTRLPGTEPAELTLIPYYLFANRDATPMQVWAPYLEK